MEPAVTGFLAGVLGGVLAHALRSFHLELQWWQTRRTLQRFFNAERKTRIAELPAAHVRQRRTADDRRREFIERGLLKEGEAVGIIGARDGS